MRPTATGSPTTSRPGRTISLSAAPVTMIDAAGVVGLGGALHDAGVLAELVADVLHDLLGGAADGLDGQRGEEEDEHGAEERADEDGDLGEVDVGEGPAGRHVAVGTGGGDLVGDDGADLFEVGGEEQEGGERGGADGVALGERLGGVAGGVERVGACRGRCRAGGTSR